MSIVTRKMYHLSGLSTDTKPIPADIATGSTFYETDSGLTFVYNKSLNQWIPSTEKPEPQINAPCVGILSIELTSRSGLIDTYTIKYTNGASTTFNVTNGGYVTPNVNINPLINNKVYNLDINTNTYKLFDIVRLTTVRVLDNKLISNTINHKKFWPRLDEAKFILSIADANELVFNYVGTQEGVETWQAIVVESVDTITRYVGHFEYVDPENKNISNYYFVATKQTINLGNIIENIETTLANEIERATVADQVLTNALADSNEALEQEVNRAKETENILLDKIEEHQEDYAELIDRLSREETRSITQDLEFDTKLNQEKAEREAEADTKVDRINFDQEIIANKLDTRQTVLFGDAGHTINQKVATIEAEADGNNKTLAIYQEVADDEKLPVENINIKAENINIGADNTTIEGNTTLDNAIVNTTTINTATVDSADINNATVDTATINNATVEGTIVFSTITDEYLDDLFPIIPVEDQGE